jgi:hypothetical protein
LFVEAGARFGRLVVIDPAARHNGQRGAIVRCDCGTIKTVNLKSLVSDTRSCGCKKSQRRTAPIGQRFGRLIVTREIISEATTAQRRTMECACDCGGTKIAELRNLERGYTLSCGCLYRENRAADATRTHGLGTHPLYHVWHGILQRCENPQARNYCNYGGRGITVYSAWHDVATFVTWIETNLGPRPGGTTGRKRRYPTHTIDRIDNDGNYEPGNVQWATLSDQANNKRRVERETTCQQCGQMFTAAVHNALYCSRACRRLAENAKKRNQPVEITCPCGNTFTSAWAPARYCSKACVKHAERSRQRRAREALKSALATMFSERLREAS